MALNGEASSSSPGANASAVAGSRITASCASADSQSAISTSRSGSSSTAYSALPNEPFSFRLGPISAISVSKRRLSSSRLPGLVLSSTTTFQPSQLSFRGNRSSVEHRLPEMRVLGASVRPERFFGLRVDGQMPMLGRLSVSEVVDIGVLAVQGAAVARRRPLVEHHDVVVAGQDVVE